MSYSVPKVYGLNASMDDVPLSLGSSQLRKPIPSSIKTVSIVSNNGNQSASGFNTFQIPTGAGTGYLRPNSVYLRCSIAVSGSGTTAETWYFNNPTHSASAVIRQLTVSIGNQNIDQITNYAEWHDAVLLHTTSKNYFQGDSAVLEKTTASAVAYPRTTPVDVVIPLLSGLFNGNKAVPLFLLASPIQVQVDFQNLNNAIIGSADTVNGFTITNAQLVFDHILVDEGYKQSVKAMMMDASNPRLFQLNLNQCLNNKVSKGETPALTYNIGASMSSVKAVLYTITADAAASNVARNFYTRDITNASDFRVLLDGQQMLNMQLNSIPVMYTEMNKCFGNQFDPNLTFALAADNAGGATTSATETNYKTKGFLGGVNCNRFNELMAMTGTPAQNIQWTLQTNGSEAAGDIVYYFILYETILTIDGAGNATLIR
jgi:hypothetical protein